VSMLGTPLQGPQDQDVERPLKHVQFLARRHVEGSLPQSSRHSTGPVGQHSKRQELGVPDFDGTTAPMDTPKDL
jgi:hypothetical protein